MDGVMDEKQRNERGDGMEEYTRRRNKHRGNMKLRVWHGAVELYRLVYRLVSVCNKVDFKLRAQIADAAQSVSANIAEG